MNSSPGFWNSIQQLQPASQQHRCINPPFTAPGHLESQPCMFEPNHKQSRSRRSALVEESPKHFRQRLEAEQHARRPSPTSDKLELSGIGQIGLTPSQVATASSGVEHLRLVTA